MSAVLDLQSTEWKALRERRLAHGGVFAWFIQCREHGTDYKAGCISCLMVDDHNAEIWEELSKEMGWMIEEPVGDVPL